MSLFLAALLLPSLFWDKGPDTANLLRQAKITHVLVPSSMEASWKSVSGISVEAADPAQFVRVATPGVTFHRNVASATRAPWVNSNGSKFISRPDGRFYYDAPGRAAALAAAEAFAYEVDATIHTDEAGLGPLGEMLQFLAQRPQNKLPALVNIGYIDDGSPESAEFMNLLVRRNLLFRVVKQPDPKLDITVQLGMPQYPRSEAANPSLLAEKARAYLTDQKRLLRIYGSEVVVGRLVGDADSTRLYLVNYAEARAPIQGLRIRVKGIYNDIRVAQCDTPDAHLLDTRADATGTEFTLPELKTFAIITLSR